MHDIYVAVWSVDTSGGWMQLDLQTRMTHLEAALDETLNRMAQDAPQIDAANGNDDVTCLFVAPEYLFTTQPQLLPAEEWRRQMEEDEAEQVKVGLAALSQTRNGMLLMPGTTSFRKSRIKMDRQGNAVKDRSEKVVQQLQGYHRVARSGHRNLADKGAWASEIQDSRMARDDLQFIGLSEGLFAEYYIARNTAWGYLNGHKRLKCHKKANVGEVTTTEAPGESTIFLPGPDFPIFSDPEVSFGVEICRDSYLGFFANTPLGNGVDVYVVLSAFVRNDEVKRPGDAKFFVHACQQRQYSVCTALNSDFRCDSHITRTVYSQNDLELYTIGDAG